MTTPELIGGRFADTGYRDAREAGRTLPISLLLDGIQVQISVVAGKDAMGQDRQRRLTAGLHHTSECPGVALCLGQTDPIVLEGERAFTTAEQDAIEIKIGRAADMHAAGWPDTMLPPRFR
ncbi:MAG: hypothetical protein ACT4NU_11865 [Chromatiales bacterium]